MAIERSTKGTGITQRNVISFKAPLTQAEEREFKKLAQKLKEDFEGGIRGHIERWACVALRNTGITLQTLQREPWFARKLFPLHLLKGKLKGKRVDWSEVNLASLAAKLEGSDSSQYYAVRALQLALSIRRGLNKVAADGENERILRDLINWSIELGKLFEQHRMKYSWEAPALLGVKIKEGQRKGGQTMASMRRTETAALHLEIRKAAARLHGGCLPREATGILARKFKRSPSQIRRILKQDLPEN